MAEAREPGYERRDVTPRGVAIAALITVAVFVSALLFAGWVLEAGERTPERGAELLPEPAPVPAPRLQERPERDLDAFIAPKTARLTSYGWVDRSAGVAHVPIERAMREVAEHGIPRWSAPRESSPAWEAQRAREHAASPREGRPR